MFNQIKNKIMAYFTADIDIEVNEFLDECSRKDIENVIEYLIKHKHISGNQLNTKLSPPEQIFESALNKIHGNWNRLTAEEEQVIYDLASKF